MKSTKASRIRDLISKGKTTNEIVALLGVTKNLVYQVKWQDAKNAKKGKSTGKPGRPRKPVNMTKNEKIANQPEFIGLQAQIIGLQNQINELKASVLALQHNPTMMGRIKSIFS